MIVFERPSWWRVIRTLRGNPIQKTWRRLTVAGLFATGITYVHHELAPLSQDLTLAPFTLTGLALGIFLGFRNNTSYDRFWEGRKLWGQIVNSTRTMARLILSLVGPEPADEAIRKRRVEHVHRVIAYAHTVRQHLRGQRFPEELKGLIPEGEVEAIAGSSNRPMRILHELSRRLREDFDRGHIDPMHHLMLEQELTVLINCQGGCERIKLTPIPFSYNVLLHQLVALYCFGLPFGLVHSIGYLTPVVVLIVAYAFFGLDAVGDEIEDPFGEDYNDLPLFAISRTIDVNLRECLGESDLPAMVRPVDNRLW
jgi:ion channel-forming bestrophin family protein